jgi:hypothetical protein
MSLNFFSGMMTSMCVSPFFVSSSAISYSSSIFLFACPGMTPIPLRYLYCSPSSLVSCSRSFFVFSSFFLSVSCMSFVVGIVASFFGVLRFSSTDPLALFWCSGAFIFS